MSFRVSVESVICRNQGLYKEVLLVKRADNCKVAPGVWNVPAGKVEMLETTRVAVVRETFEETNLKVDIIKFLAEQAFEIKVEDKKAFRNMFTYLTKPVDNFQQVELNDEHTEFKWVTKEGLESEQFSSLMPRLKALILQGFNHDTK